MRSSRPNVDTVLTMALAVARKEVERPANDRELSEEMRAAIAQVWDLVKSRLPAASVETLDPLIRVIVDQQAGGHGH